MNATKPFLSIEDQIEHLKSKGVIFNIVSEDEAKAYLENHNNYFKLTSYRKNYQKHPDGINKGKYIELEFAYLVDLSIIDMYLRYRIVQIALDLEHHIKLELMREAQKNNEDGYQVIQDYIDSLSDKQKLVFYGELEKNKKSIYCCDLVYKYYNNLPIWVFIEIVPLGRLISFYKFCSERYSNKFMLDNYYIFLTCKEIRNAAAHSNCILNDLKSNNIKHRTNAKVTNELMSIPNMNSNLRKNRMSNDRIQQIVTLLYAHKTMVCSGGLNYFESEQLKMIKDRINKNYHYFDNNKQIQKSFDFICIVIDNWFNCKYYINT